LELLVDVELDERRLPEGQRLVDLRAHRACGVAQGVEGGRLLAGRAHDRDVDIGYRQILGDADARDADHRVQARIAGFAHEVLRQRALDRAAKHFGSSRHQFFLLARYNNQTITATAVNMNSPTPATTKNSPVSDIVPPW